MAVLASIITFPEYASLNMETGLILKLVLICFSGTLTNGGKKMSKQSGEMIGVPPAERLRFVCKRRSARMTDGNVKYLIQLLEKEEGVNSRHSQQILNGVTGFLKNTDGTHCFEGRAGYYAKNSFAETELETALSFAEDRLKVEYLVYRYKFAEYSQKKIVSDFPIVVAIEPTSWCNLRCIMCFQADRRFFTDKSIMGFMDMGLYQRLVDEMAENQPCSLVLASRGEPMLHKDFVKMVSYATQNGIIDVKININATRLTEEKSRELLEAEPTTIVFSVDAGGKKEFEAIRIGANFDQVVANIMTFNKIRTKEFPHSRTKTRISMTIFRESQDAEAAENLWSDMVDEFAIHSADYRLDIYDHPLLPNEVRPCNLLWERLYIWWDGKVNPCDIDYKSHLCLGQIGKDHPTIRSAWLGEQMQQMRRDHLAGQKNRRYPCNQCYGV